MSLTGNAEGKVLRGTINKLTELRGYSAYEVALLNGFSGTEEEWLDSLEVNPDAVVQAVNAYMAAHPVGVDTTLSVSGQAADAKATGDGLARLGVEISNVNNSVSESVARLGEEISTVDESIASIGEDLARVDGGVSDAADHAANKENPHGVTAEQIGAAEASHEHSADDITSGVLPIARGGTGATKAADALANLGALSKEGGTITGTLYINNTTDASSTADKNPALILGNRDGDHIVFDGNEIIPKSGATSAGALYLGDSESTVISISGLFRLNSKSYGSSLPTAGTAGRVFFKKV